MAYIYTTTVKAYLGVSGASDDALIGDLIARAQAIIDEELGFSFESTTDTTRYFNPLLHTNAKQNGKRGDRLTLYFDTWLAALAASNPINIKADGTPEAVAAANYYLVPTNEGPPYYGVRLLPSKGVVWEYENDPDRGVSVEGKWAWSETAPNDIVHAAIRLTAFLYRQKDASADLDRPLLTADGVVILPSTMPNDVMKVLDKYRSLSAWPGHEPE